MARRRTLPTLPALGPGYRKLWTATALSTAGDGIYYTALPLLAAGLTRDPLAVAAVQVGGDLPWLLFALKCFLGVHAA